MCLRRKRNARQLGRSRALQDLACLYRCSSNGSCRLWERRRGLAAPVLGGCSNVAGRRRGPEGLAAGAVTAAVGLTKMSASREGPPWAAAGGCPAAGAPVAAALPVGAWRWPSAPVPALLIACAAGTAGLRGVARLRIMRGGAAVGATANDAGSFRFREAGSLCPRGASVLCMVASGCTTLLTDMSSRLPCAAGKLVGATSDACGAGPGWGAWQSAVPVLAGAAPTASSCVCFMR